MIKNTSTAKFTCSQDRINNTNVFHYYFLPMSFSCTEIFLCCYLNPEVNNWRITKWAGPMRFSKWFNWSIIGWYSPRDWVICTANQHPSSAVSNHVTPDLEEKMLRVVFFELFILNIVFRLSRAFFSISLRWGHIALLSSSQWRRQGGDYFLPPPPFCPAPPIKKNY